MKTEIIPFQSDKELHKSTRKLVNTPYFIDEAVKRVRSGGERELSWCYSRIITASQKQQMDYWLIDIGHALSMQPGTNEARFNAVVRQRNEEMP